MTIRDRGEGFPANAIIASFVFDILEQHGVFRRSGLAERIRAVSDRMPSHLRGEQRVASLAALRYLVDDPAAPRVTLREWFNS
jgi:exopolyphosphatase/pppGpp-phosphohydrolase